jgi:hypothetical protein
MSMQSTGLGRGLSVWTTLAGSACLAGAAALAIAPRFDPSAAWIAVRFQPLGVVPGTLAVGGLLLLAAAGLSRSLRHSHQVLTVPEEPDKRIDALAAELVSTRGQLQDLRIEFVYLKDALTKLGREGEELRKAQESTRDTLFAARDTVVGLVGAFDQLTARTDHQTNTVLGAVQHAARETELAIANLRLYTSSAAERPPGPFAAPIDAALDESFGPYVAGEQSADQDGELDVWVELDAALPENEAREPDVLDTLEALDREVRAGLAERTTEIDQKLAQVAQLLADPAVKRAYEIARRDQH